MQTLLEGPLEVMWESTRKKMYISIIVCMVVRITLSYRPTFIQSVVKRLANTQSSQAFHRLSAL